jgi:type I restriction enzyme R subunit
MTPNISNENIIQKNVIQLLKDMGYIYISREDNLAMRVERLGDAIFKDVLLKQLQKLNSFVYKGVEYKFSPKNISRAVDELDVPLNEGLMVANQKISDKLVLGTSYDEELSDGVKKSFSLRYIDFNNTNNIFHFTEEYSVSRQYTLDTEKHRRPDIVLFINGIPFAVIELKKSSIEAEQGISQMIRNQGNDEIPQLFKYVQITLAANNHTPKYATTGTPSKFYAVWEEEYQIGQLEKMVTTRSISNLDKTIYALFSKTRVLDLLHSFILFDNRIKKIARYQQYFAIQETLHKIKKIDSSGSRAGGLIWHTQGSGKSLTMAMLTRLIKRELIGSKIIVVTDRKDLDSQIHATFQNSEIKAGRASSGHDLIEKLQSGVSVITTLIHKFETVEKEKVVFNDPNIFVLVDESHRTQGGDLHKAMKKVFPLGCYLGFTGTPLLKREKNSIAKFGGLIHKYTIEQAVRDKSVLPLLYEGRLVDQWLTDKEGLDRRFEMIARDLNTEQKADLKQKWARFSRVASSERRLEMIALDINEHFTHNIQGTGFKGMLATSSKYEAIKYHTIFEELGNIKTAFVISAPDSREGFDEVDESNKQFVNEAWNKLIKQYVNEESFLDKVKGEFIDGDELELLIVVDKLLTGFDAPRAAVLYIDKELKEHSLLQAIARVNRLYDGKDFGFIIDYRGLLGNLGSALTSYAALAGFDEEDIAGAVIDIKTEIARIKTYFSHLQNLFNGIVNKNDQESYEVFLGDKEKREEFYDLLSQFARSLKLALSSDKIDDILTQEEVALYKRTMKFYSELRKSIKVRYQEEVDFGKYEQQMQKLLDTFISANEVNQLTKLVNIFEEDFDKEIERVVGNNSKADTILSAATKVITEKRELNPTHYDKMSKRIQDVIEEYRNGRLSDEDKLKHAKDIRAMLMAKQDEDASEYPVEIRNSSCASALFENLRPSMQELNLDVFIKAMIQMNDIFKVASKKPDWEHNMDVRNEIDQAIDDVLWNLEKEHNIKFSDSTKIISIARSIGINNYAR